MPYGLWIRVDAHEVHSPLVARLAEALGLKPVHALGHLVALAGQVAEQTSDGRIKDVPDVTLEQWAVWERPRGKFAAAVRQHVQDAETGEMAGWYEKMFQLVKHRERDAERKRKERRRSGSTSARSEPISQASEASPPDIRGQSVDSPPPRNGTEENKTPESGNSVGRLEPLPEASEIFIKQYFGEATPARRDDVRCQFRAALQPYGVVIKRDQRAVAVDGRHLARAIGRVLRAQPQPPNSGAAVVWVLRELERTRLEYMSEQSREPGERIGGGTARIGSILLNAAPTPVVTSA